MFLFRTTWWQQLLPALPPLNFTPGSGSSFLSCFCFLKRHTEVRSCQRFIQNKSSFQVNIRLNYPSLLDYCCVFVFLHLILYPRETQDIWLETILPVCRCASRLAAAEWRHFTSVWCFVKRNKYFIKLNVFSGVYTIRLVAATCVGIKLFVCRQKLIS